MVDDTDFPKIDDFLIQNVLQRRKAITIYRAIQQSLKRFVLIKVISISGISENHPQLSAAFETYVRAVVALEHLHLQPIYRQGVVDEDHIYVAGRLISSSLHELLKAGALPVAHAEELALQIYRC